MTKLEILFIRACKSSSYEYRLKRLYKMFYYGDFNWTHMLSILVGIVSDNRLINVDQLVRQGYLNPEKAWQYGAEDDWPYERRAAYAMISIIRLTKVSDLVGFIKAAKFRRLNNVEALRNQVQA
jgi:hypothetical protein